MWQAVCFRQKLNILGDNGFGLMAVTVLRGQPKHQPQGNGRLKGLERARQLVPRAVLMSLVWGRVQCANCALSPMAVQVTGSACEVQGICTQSLRDWVCYFSCLGTCNFSYSRAGQVGSWFNIWSAAAFQRGPPVSPCTASQQQTPCAAEGLQLLSALLLTLPCHQGHSSRAPGSSRDC